MATTLVRTIPTTTGEVAVYQDVDGYHAERWDAARQMVVAQSGDHDTESGAVEAVTEIE